MEHLKVEEILGADWRSRAKATFGPWAKREIHQALWKRTHLTLIIDSVMKEAEAKDATGFYAGDDKRYAPDDNGRLVAPIVGAYGSESNIAALSEFYANALGGTRKLKHPYEGHNIIDVLGASTVEGAGTLWHLSDHHYEKPLGFWLLNEEQFTKLRDAR